VQLGNIETTKSQARIFGVLKDANAAVKQIQQVGAAFYWLLVNSNAALVLNGPESRSPSGFVS
jgi:hypothetical protein